MATEADGHPRARKLGFGSATVLVLALAICAPLAVYYGAENHELVGQVIATTSRQKVETTTLKQYEYDVLDAARVIERELTALCGGHVPACPPLPKLPKT